MLEFLLLSAFVLMAAALAAIVALPLLLIGGLIWLITLPFRLLFWMLFGAVWLVTLPFRLAFWMIFGVVGLAFSMLFGAVRLVFGIIGGVLGLLFAPVVLVLGVVGLAVMMLVWLVSALAPLVPLLLVGLLIWGVYRLVAPRPSPTF